MKKNTQKEESIKPSTLSSDLFTSIPAGERESFVQQFMSLEFCREHMIKYFQSELERESKRSEDIKNYSLPAWSEMQADSNGYRRAVRKMVHMLGGTEFLKMIEAEENGREEKG